jgi:hypothetical protein
MSLEGDCCDIEVTSNLVAFGLSLDGVWHEHNAQFIT